MNSRNKEQVVKMSWQDQKVQQLSDIVQWNPMRVLKTNMRSKVNVSILEELVKNSVRATFLTLTHKVPLENDPETRVVALSANAYTVMPLRRTKA